MGNTVGNTMGNIVGNTIGNIVGNIIGNISNSRHVLPEVGDIQLSDSLEDQPIPVLQQLKTRVDTAKGMYDGLTAEQHNNLKNFHYKHKDALEGKNIPQSTNATIKAIELFQYYKVFPSSADSFVYFDNAALPGAFILAANYMVSTMHDIKQFKWYGSSMLPDKKVNNDAISLGDKFNLYRNYKSRWLMSDDKNNGDVRIVANQLNFKEHLGNKVDLYTSDLGFGTGYLTQEKEHAHANFGQIITGLIVLKRGGIMITKQYSYFDSCTISTMAIMTKMFDSVEICKPMFSKQANSETYLVGIGFRDNFHLYRDCMFERLENWKYTPLVEMKLLNDEFIDAIIKSQTYFAEAQIAQINWMICDSDTDYMPTDTQRSQLDVRLRAWKNSHTLPIMDDRYQLNTRPPGYQRPGYQRQSDWRSSNRRPSDRRPSDRRPSDRNWRNA